MAENNKEIKEVKAYARGIHMSPRKVRLVAVMLKDMSVAEALDNLAFVTKKAALPIRKLVNSGVANASHNFQIAAERLFIKNLTVDGGPVMKRFKPRAQGRAFPIRRRTSHINLVLGVSNKAIKPKRKLVIPAKKAEPAAKTEGEIASEKPTEKKGWSLFRKKTEGHESQIPIKQDAHGKHYTSFDRRGNMGD